VNLSSDIKDLILLNEGLILPGLGGFVTKYHPAEIRRNSNVFDPPSMEIKFDSRMITDNGLLVSRVAKKNKISEEEARSVVIDYVESLKRDLQEKDTASIDEVGILVKDSSGNLTFKALTGQNYRIQSFGLPEVEVPPFAKPPEIPRRTLPPPVFQPVSKKRIRIPLAAVIVALVLLGAGVVYFTGLFDRYLKPLFVRAEPVVMLSEDNADKIVFGQQVTADEDTLATEVNQQLTVISSKEKALRYEEPKKTEPVQPETSVEITETPVILAPVNQSGEFHIIAGSFLIPGNADRQKNALEKKGYTPQIIRKNDDFFYVALQAFDSKETAMAEMRKLRQELDLPLWVMKR
jgi:nucleoid DNA-binding protein